MIVKLHKFLIYGSKDSLDSFFELSQRAGFLEFIGLSRKRALEMPDDAKAILAAIKIAKHHEIHPLETSPVHSPVEVAKRLIDLTHQHEQFKEEERLLKGEIARVGPFGNFSRTQLHQLEREVKRVFQFFCMRSALAREIVLPPELIFLGTQYDLDYFVSINREKVQYPKMIEVIIDRPLGELIARLEFVTDRILKLESDIRHESNALPYLSQGLTHLLNEYHLRLAKHDASTPMDSSLFAIEAWVPETRIVSLRALIEKLEVCAEEIAIEEADQVPTCLENKGIGKVGEDLVLVYDTPAITDKDPSLWVVLVFPLFFAMIIGDAGYGCLFLALSFWLKRRFWSCAGIAKRLVKLSFLLSIFSIGWGISTASYFGIELAPDSSLRKVSFVHYLASKKADYYLKNKGTVYQEYLKEYPAIKEAKTPEQFFLLSSKETDGKKSYPILDDFYNSILLEISILAGLIHLSLSMLRTAMRNLPFFGWILFLWGGYLYFPKMIHALTIVQFCGLISPEASLIWGFRMLIGGVGAAVIAALFQRKWMGIFEITSFVQVFADVVSYVRLYALALSGMIMAKTFNEIGLKVGIVFGTFVILVGHITNIGLSIMGGVIHGLRLNFLEWYRYSFEGGGRLFNPLKLKK